MKALFLFFCLFAFSATYAQIPAGYYDAAAGLSGSALKTALHNIISNGFVSISYDNLPDAYMTTDRKANGKVWDMYSDIPGGTPPYEFTFTTDQCGSYSNEGDCYNREHSVPQSWFGGSSPMYSDIFHVVPTDGYVNGKRSNYPFGEVGSASWTSQNGSKLGTCNFPGYSGTVFEPIDSFKGDFARIYFYMCVRYKDEMPSWTGESFSGGDLSSWTENMLLQWHTFDPVSQKERDRNDDVYSLQHNRNPFVDQPDWVFSIWGPTADIMHYDEYALVVFPNPANSLISISTVEGKAPSVVYVCDLQGRIILAQSGESQIDTRELENGFYLLRCIVEESIVEERLIVQH